MVSSRCALLLLALLAACCALAAGESAGPVGAAATAAPTARCADDDKNDSAAACAGLGGLSLGGAVHWPSTEASPAAAGEGAAFVGWALEHGEWLQFGPLYCATIAAFLLYNHRKHVRFYRWFDGVEESAERGFGAKPCRPARVAILVEN